MALSEIKSHKSYKKSNLNTKSPPRNQIPTKKPRINAKSKSKKIKAYINNREIKLKQLLKDINNPSKQITRLERTHLNQRKHRRKNKKQKQINMTTFSTEQQAFRDKLMPSGLSATNINRIVNQSISDTMELVMMDSDTLFTDGAMGSGAPGIMAGAGAGMSINWAKEQLMLHCLMRMLG